LQNIFVTSANFFLLFSLLCSIQNQKDLVLLNPFFVMLLSRLVFMSVELKRRIIQGQELIHFGIHFQYQVHYWSGGEVENGGKTALVGLREVGDDFGLEGD
jgi:hypothetical protein